MPDKPETARVRWPRDLKLFASLAAIWGTILTAQAAIDAADYLLTPLETVFLGMKFEGDLARPLIEAQATIVFAAAFGVLFERKWGLWLALIYALELVVSSLIFMMTYMDDLSQGRSVRALGLVGIASVLVLLYLWIRARDILFE